MKKTPFSFCDPRRLATRDIRRRLCSYERQSVVRNGSVCNRTSPGSIPTALVLDWLHDAFTKYLASPEEEDLAKLLKAKRGKGKTPIKKETRKLQIETNAMNRILALNVRGIAIEKAAALVEEHFTTQGIEIQSSEVLAERFTKRGWGTIAKVARDMIKDARGD